MNICKLIRCIRAHSLECDAYALEVRANDYALTARRRRSDATRHR